VRPSRPLHPVLFVQVILAGWLGVSGAVAQPSFDAITQRNIAPGAQGRTFARFAVRQQLLWVIGALIPGRHRAQLFRRRPIAGGAHAHRRRGLRRSDGVTPAKSDLLN
jgi:hypothetical protein